MLKIFLRNIRTGFFVLHALRLLLRNKSCKKKNNKCRTAKQ